MFIGLATNIWCIYMEVGMLLQAYSQAFVNMQLYFIVNSLVSIALMLVGLRDRKFAVDPVFVAYLLIIAQVIIKESDFVMLNSFEDFEEELHFLAFARGPLLLIML